MGAQPHSFIFVSRNGYSCVKTSEYNRCDRDSLAGRSKYVSGFSQEKLVGLQPAAKNKRNDWMGQMNHNEKNACESEADVSWAPWEL